MIVKCTLAGSDVEPRQILFIVPYHLHATVVGGRVIPDTQDLAPRLVPS